MKLSIICASREVLSADKFEKIIMMTEAGQITILSGHEPLLSAIKPGILSVDYYVGGKIHSSEYVTGGWVLMISPSICTIVADVVTEDESLTDIEYINSQKAEAAELVRMYKIENGATIDPHKLIELENELLRYTAMHELGKKYHESWNSRK